MTSAAVPQAQEPRIPILLVGLLGVVLLAAVGVFWAAAPAEIQEDMSPVEFALGDHIGTWLAASGCTDVVVVDTAWPLTHLQKLAAGRKAGLTTALKTIPVRFVLAQGIGLRKNAWDEAISTCGPGTALVALHGIAPGAQLPGTFKSLVVVGEADGTGLPQEVLAKAQGRIIKARGSLLDRVNAPEWKGSVQDRFAAAYEDLELKPAKTSGK